MSVNMRPRFRYLIAKPTTQITDELKLALKKNNHPFTGVVTPHHASIHFKKSFQEFFTPHIDLSIDAHDEGSLIRGIIGPKPQIWTLFAFAHGISGVLALAGLMIGLSQVGMDKPAHAFWLLPIGGILSLMTYLVAQFGQKMAQDQTYQLYAFLMDLLGYPSHVEWEDL